MPEERAYYRIWLDFFQQVSVLMDFRRGNPETALSESPEITEILIKYEIAYGNVVSKMREAADIRQKQDEDAQARRKADRAKARRLKGRSMDFLMPGKEKRLPIPLLIGTRMPLACHREKKSPSKTSSGMTSRMTPFRSE
ncbi:MAG TPA: hypothetical protein VF797_21165 [Noviherbaspirillum sp.]